MVTDPGRSFLGGFNSALAYGARRPDPALGAQRLADANRLITLSQAQSADFALQGAISGDLGVQILNNSDPGADGRTILSVPDNVDVTKLGQIIQNNGAVTKFTDPNGNIQTAKSVRIAPAPDGAADRFVIEVEREDGVFAPKTVGASQDPNDPVRVFTGAELRDLSNATLSGLVVDSGRDVFQGRLLALAGANRLDAEAISSANQMAEMNPAMAGQFLQTFKALPYEDKIRALQEFGVDTDAILADANTVQTPTSDPGVDTIGLTSAGFYTVDGANDAIKDKGIRRGGFGNPAGKIRDLAEEIEELENSIGNNTASELRDIRAKQAKLNTELQALLDDPDNVALSSAQQRLKRLQSAQANDQKRIDDLLDQGKTVDNSEVRNFQKRVDERAQTIADLEKQIGPADDQLDVTNSVTGANNQRVRLNDKEMQTALRRRFLNPTQEDYGVMRNFLRENNITTFEQVRQAVSDGRINKENQVRLAALIAMAQPTLTAGATKAKSPLDAYTAAMTEMETGRMTPADRATLAIRRDELDFRVTEFNANQLDKYGEAEEAALGRIEEMDKVLFDVNGQYMDDGDDEYNFSRALTILNTMGTLASRPTGNVAAANRDRFFQAFAKVAGAAAQREGAASWGDKWNSFFQNDIQQKLGGQAGSMRIRRDSAGVFQALVFKDTQGRTDLNFTLTKSDLEKFVNAKTIKLLEDNLPDE